MDAIPDIIQNAAVEIIVGVVVAIVGGLVSSILAIINIRNEKKRAAALFTWGSVLIFVFTGGFVIIGVLSSVYWDLTSSGSTDILVADFDGVETEHYRMAEILRERLRIVSTYADSIEISGTDAIKETDGQDAAVDVGNNLNAEIIIWGWYGIVDDVYIRVNIETLESANRQLPITPGVRIVLQDDPGLFGDFTLQKTLGDELADIAFGLYCYADGNWHCAIENLSRVINNLDTAEITYLNPAALYLYRGGAYHSSDQIVTAIADYSAAIDLDAHNPLAFYVRGLAYESENIPQALADYSAAIQLKDNFWDAYERRVVLFAGLGEYSKAVEENERMISLRGPWRPDSEIRNLIIEAYMQDGFLYANDKNYEQALVRFNRVIEIDYQYYDAYYYRGLTYLNLDQRDKAIADFKKYIEEGDDPELVNMAKDNNFEIQWPLLHKWFGGK